MCLWEYLARKDRGSFTDMEHSIKMAPQLDDQIRIQAQNQQPNVNHQMFTTLLLVVDQTSNAQIIQNDNLVTQPKKVLLALPHFATVQQMELLTLPLFVAQWRYLMEFQKSALEIV